MKNPDKRIYVQNGRHGLDIYLDVSGVPHYITTRRPNGLLYQWLKDGKTIGEISRMKPKYTRTAQKTYHYAQYLVKLIAAYVTNDLAA